LKLSDELAKNYPVPDRFLVEIGRISALWATLESSLNMGLGKLAGFNELNHPAPFILITHSSFQQRLDMLSTFCELLSSDFENLKDYAKVVSSLRQAQTLRNRFAHNGLDYDSTSDSCSMILGSALGKLKVEVIPVSIATLREASEQVHLAMLSLHKLITGIEYPAIWERE
jgi:hypothetical protein